MIKDLTVGARKVDPGNFPGSVWEVPGGGTVRIRADSLSRSQGVVSTPTININVPNWPQQTLHFK